MSRRSTVQGPLIEFLPANPDRVISVDELVRTLNLKRTSVQGAMRRLTAQFPDHIEPRGHTAWVWHSDARTVKQERANRELVLLKVLKEKEDGSLLAQDEESQQIYICRPVEF